MKDRIAKPYEKDDIVYMKPSLIRKWPDYQPYRYKLLRVVSIYKGICQTGWFVSVKHPQVPNLVAMDSGWFHKYKGGTQTVEENEADK